MSEAPAANGMARAGIEPAFPGLQAGVLPLNERAEEKEGGRKDFPLPKQITLTHKEGDGTPARGWKEIGRIRTCDTRRFPHRL